MLPGSTSLTHSGTPRGADSAWMFPPGACALPAYHRLVSRPFLLIFFSAHRSEATILPSRIRYGSPSSRAFPGPCRSVGGEHFDGLDQVPVSGGLGDLEAPAQTGNIGPVL